MGELILLVVILVGIFIAPFVKMYIKYLIELAIIKKTPSKNMPKEKEYRNYTSTKLPWESSREIPSDASLSDKDRKAIAKAVADGIYYSRIREGKNPGNYTLTEDRFDD